MGIFVERCPVSTPRVQTLPIFLDKLVVSSHGSTSARTALGASWPPTLRRAATTHAAPASAGPVSPARPQGPHTAALPTTARVQDPLTAIIVSVTAVLFFGEIIPQALCSRCAPPRPMHTCAAQTRHTRQPVTRAAFLPCPRLLSFLQLWSSHRGQLGVAGSHHDGACLPHRCAQTRTGPGLTSAPHTAAGPTRRRPSLLRLHTLSASPPLAAWPVGKLLDYLLGADHHTLFRRTQLKAGHAPRSPSPPVNQPHALHATTRARVSAPAWTHSQPCLVRRQLLIPRAAHALICLPPRSRVAGQALVDLHGADTGLGGKLTKDEINVITGAPPCLPVQHVAHIAARHVRIPCRRCLPPSAVTTPLPSPARLLFSLRPALPGALDLTHKIAFRSMTPLDKCFMLSLEETLNDAVGPRAAPPGRDKAWDEARLVCQQHVSWCGGADEPCGRRWWRRCWRAATRASPCTAARSARTSWGWSWSRSCCRTCAREAR
jgi:hypothetical protein